MAKMFKGISATYSAVAAAKSSTQSVFDEFKMAAAAATVAANGEQKTKGPVACTPEERQELDLFEKVEAEIDKFGEDEEADEQAVCFVIVAPVGTKTPCLKKPFFHVHSLSWCIQQIKVLNTNNLHGWCAKKFCLSPIN